MTCVCITEQMQRYTENSVRRRRQREQPGAGLGREVGGRTHQVRRRGQAKGGYSA